jgi:hypothetical protein
MFVLAEVADDSMEPPDTNGDETIFSTGSSALLDDAGRAMNGSLSFGVAMAGDA